jgi:hypothetical protein
VLDEDGFRELLENGPAAAAEPEKAEETGITSESAEVTG